MAAQVFGNILASAKSGYEDIAGSVMEKSSSRKYIVILNTLHTIIIIVSYHVLIGWDSSPQCTFL